MIYNLARDLDTRLAARLFPVRVAYGPERCVREGYDPFVLLERDREASDKIGPPVGSQRNPRLITVRALAVVALIYARSTLPGARVEDHEHDCEQVVDALITELYAWGSEGRTGGIAFTEARYLAAADRNDVETWPGVVYRLKFSVPRGVRVLDYVGAGRPTGTPAGVGGDVEIRRNADDPPEVVNLP